ncbi:MAG: polysaccharide deacetylase family protein [Bryobacterales bacterium]|nr:polysaccharide deacetylase family protein [Bryobacterales bacterium]
MRSASNPVILTYHSIDDSGSVISTSPRDFRRQMRSLAESGRPVVGLSEVAGTPGGVAITFDDGFRNLLDVALPVLRQYSFPATVFVVSRFAGGTNRWWQPVAGIPELPLMTWGEIREVLAGGIAVGAHSRSHPDLTRLSAGEAETELAGSKADLEQAIGRPVRALAYPYGLRSAALVELARRHFSVACSTELRGIRPGGDPLDLPRIDTCYLKNPIWFRNLQTPAGTAYVFVRRLLRELRSLPVEDNCKSS